MIEKHIRKLLDLIEKKSEDQLNENITLQGVMEGSEWETRHDEFVTVGNRATPDQINKIVSALGVAAKQVIGKRGFLNQTFGKQSNDDLTRMAHSAETLAKNIQRNSNAKPGTDERKELGQNLVYAVSLLKRISGEQGMAEGLDKSTKRGMAGWPMPTRKPSPEQGMAGRSAFDEGKPADGVKRVKGPASNAWDKLPNAKLIDQVLSELKANPKVFARAWHAAGPSVERYALWNAASPATWRAVRDAALDAAWGASAPEVRDAALVARGAILAFITYDDAPKYLAVSYEKLKTWAELNKDPAATLLLPYVWAREQVKGLSPEQGAASDPLKESSIKFGIKKALKEGYWDDISKRLNKIGQTGVSEAAKWRDDDLKGKTWRSANWDDGDLSPSKIKIDRSGKDVDDSGDELKIRPAAWRGKSDMAKRMTKKGVPTKAELGSQDNLKMRMRIKKKEGGLTGPKGVLPEERDVAEGMPSSVAKHKQQLASMSDKEFAEKYGNKSDEELMAMAWRNGYGKGSKFYVNKKNKGTSQNVTESSNDSPVARSILRRIMMQHPALLRQYGPEMVMVAVDDIADSKGDVEEIGSSDVSIWVKQVEDTLKIMDRTNDPYDMDDPAPMEEGQYSSLKEGRVDYDDPNPQAIVTYNDGKKLKARLLTGSVKGELVTWQDSREDYTTQYDIVERFRKGDTIDLDISNQGYYVIRKPTWQEKVKNKK